MPVASSGPSISAHYHYEDLDNTYRIVAPPTINTWYTVWEGSDARLLTCFFTQRNDVPQNRICEIRWTLDGNVYTLSLSLASGTGVYIYRNYLHNLTGGPTLIADTAYRQAVRQVDKRAKEMKIEMRMTAAIPAGCSLECYLIVEKESVT